MLYDEPWTSHTPDYTLAEQGFGPGYDFLTTAGRLLDLFKPAVPLFAQLAQSSLFKVGPVGPGSWGELFGNKVARTKVASGSVAVEQKHALHTLDALIALNKKAGGVPVVFGCRYVAQSRALLAMNRGPKTFVISVDGVWNKATMKFLEAIPAMMAAEGIPFTQHWGKVNGGTPAQVLASHGVNVGEWIAARHTLMPDPVDRAMFTNDYMRERGLDL